MLKIDRAGLEAIEAQALEEYPAECCGILSADAGSDASFVHRCENIQDRLHAADANQYPRESGEAYYIDPSEQYRVISETERAGGRITGFYHSHIDCEAYFSDEDQERTMVWGEPAYPEVVYLVISVCADGVRGRKAFLWQEETRSYREVKVEVVG